MGFIKYGFMKNKTYITKHPKGGEMKKEMKLTGQAKNRTAQLINTVESSDEHLTSRAGLALIMNYIERTGILSRLNHKFKHLKGSTKGTTVEAFFKQVIAYMIDGSKLDLVVFDELKKDPSYATLLETLPEDLISSHQVKRLFRKFSNSSRQINVFRDLQSDIFISHLRDEKPDVVIIGVDTMVMDNDNALQREGCTPTYKKKKGFQPLEFYWNDIIIDAIFREGKCHSNHGDDVKKAVKRIVKRIRKGYSLSVPIILKMDSGFMSDENFRYFEESGILYISAGKMYGSIKDYIGELPVNNRHEYKGSHLWEYVEFGNRLESWDNFRRAIYLQQKSNSTGQFVLDFASSDRIIYTNIGIQQELSANLSHALKRDISDPEYIIKEYHDRARDELCNRAFKDFATRENLPFKGFAQNQMFYYLLTLSHILLQSYVKDICYDIIEMRSYPTTIRRRIIDFAGKFVFHSRKLVLKVSYSTFNRLKLNLLWERCRTHNRVILYV